VPGDVDDDQVIAAAVESSNRSHLLVVDLQTQKGAELAPAARYVIETGPKRKLQAILPRSNCYQQRISRSCRYGDR
jgi:hypothetical protein